MNDNKVTKFNLEAAFKALDKIEIPMATKTKPNKLKLTERLTPQPKTECLLEDYYNVNDNEDLGVAKEQMEDDIAKAKLAKIEKIVDLNAETVDDIQPSYVGKIVIQCPQCMEKFYYDSEDIEESDDPEMVNVGEKCQHCGNEDGYMLIGKIDEVRPEELELYTDKVEETPEGEEEELEDVEEVEEETPEEEGTEEEPDLNEFDVDMEEVEEPEEEEKAEESFKPSSSNYLNETFDFGPEYDYLDDEEGYIDEYDDLSNIYDEGLKESAVSVDQAFKDFEADIDGEEVEESLDYDDEMSDQEFAEALQGLKEAVGDDVNNISMDDAIKQYMNSPIYKKANQKMDKIVGEEVFESKQCEACNEEACEGKECKDGEECKDGSCETEKPEKETLNENTVGITQADFGGLPTIEIKKSDVEGSLAKVANDLKADEAKLQQGCEQLANSLKADNNKINTILTNTPTDESLDECGNNLKEDINFDAFEDEINQGCAAFCNDLVDEVNDKYGDTDIEDAEIDTDTMDECIAESLKAVYENVQSFQTTKHSYANDKLVVEGIINMSNGETLNTTYTFKKSNKVANALVGLNEDLVGEKSSKIRLNYELVEGKLITKNIQYRYIVEGLPVKGSVESKALNEGVFKTLGKKIIGGAKALAAKADDKVKSAHTKGSYDTLDDMAEEKYLVVSFDKNKKPCDAKEYLNYEKFVEADKNAREASKISSNAFVKVYMKDDKYKGDENLVCTYKGGKPVDSPKFNRVKELITNARALNKINGSKDDNFETEAPAEETSKETKDAKTAKDAVKGIVTDSDGTAATESLQENVDNKVTASKIKSALKLVDVEVDDDKLAEIEQKLNK